MGDFLNAYQRSDDEILSIHLSSGLSGAYSSTEHATRMVPDKDIIVIDSRTVGPALGWMVEAAAYGVKQGWSKEHILEAIQQVKENTITKVAFTELSHLVESAT